MSPGRGEAAPDKGGPSRISSTHATATRADRSGRVLQGCGAIDGHVVACPEEVRPRLVAIERAKELGLDTSRLEKATQRVIDVHLREAMARREERRR